MEIRIEPSSRPIPPSKCVPAVGDRINIDSIPAGVSRLFEDIRQLIEAARSRVATAVNSELVVLYWRVGARVRQDVLNEKRAGYGQGIVSALSRQLSQECTATAFPRNLCAT